MRRSGLIAIAIVCIVSMGALVGSSPPSRALQATPAATVPAPVVISSEVLGRATPASVDNPELALGRVTIMPGAVIPSHYHPGTQIGVVIQGTLTYSVFTGEVALYRANAADSAPELVGAGDTVQVGIGDALVEPPGSIHQGRNDGVVPVVIYLSTLFPSGDPRAILAEPPPSE